MRRALLLLITSAACGGSFDGTGTLPAGHRLITGQLEPPSQSELTLQPIALQLAAISIDASKEPPIQSMAVSPAFNPAANGGRPVRFRIALPTDRAFSLLFQVPLDGREGIGRYVALLRFPKNAAGDLTDVLSGAVPGTSAPLADLDLGTVKIRGRTTSNGGATLAGSVALLGEGDARNPLSQNDADGDGTPDLDDADDDGDLFPDDVDADANGDGLVDAEQSFDALAPLDLDGDSIPDIFQP